jgi:Tat protein secretion system quality control protein TatD with DNase activity
MCPPDKNEESSTDDVAFPTSDIITDLLSILPQIPDSLHARLNDAHCHPTDHPHTLSRLDRTASGTLASMSTRPDDQSLVMSFADENPDVVVPFLGYHPWYSHLFFTSTGKDHYPTILKPSPPEDFTKHLPKPISWEKSLSDLRTRLEQNPDAQVGEIGIDKSFRLPTHVDGQRQGLSQYKTSAEHQTRIFTDQVLLAIEFSRAVSVHSVQCHGLIFQTLQTQWSKNPSSNPRICIHSASIPPETLKQYISSKVPWRVYFSFSMAINSRYGGKLLELIGCVPEDRILIESDWHSEGRVRRKQLVDIARVVLHVKGWDTEHGIDILERNFQTFIKGE